MHLSPPRPDGRSSSGASAATAMLVPLMVAWGYLLVLSEKVHVGLESLCRGTPSAGGGSPNTPPPLSAAGASGREEGEQHSSDDSQEEERQERERCPPRRRANEFNSSSSNSSVAAYLRRILFPSSLSSSSSTRRHDRARKARQQQKLQQQQSRAPAFTAPSTPSADDGPAAAGSSRWRFAQPSKSGRKDTPSRARIRRREEAAALLPAATTSRARQTDKTLCVDLEEMLIQARDDIREMGESRFDFMWVAPQQHPSAGRGVGGGGSAAGGGGGGGRGGRAERGFERGAGSTRRRRVFVRKRPHLGEFLQAASEMFEIVLMTGVLEEGLVEAVLDQIDPERKLVDYALSGDRWMKPDGNGGEFSGGERDPFSGVKDLGLIGRPLSKVGTKTSYRVRHREVVQQSCGSTWLS